jgi:hypothetical protein
LASADEKLRSFFLDHVHLAANKNMRNKLTTGVPFSNLDFVGNAVFNENEVNTTL